MSNGLRILVADDLETNRMLFRTLLERRGHACVLAEDGIAALEAVAAGGIDLGPLEPRLPELLRTPSGKVELAPALLLDDLQKKRYLVLPGMTGLWQVSGRSDVSFDDLVRLDFYYIETWSIWLDLVILVRTIPAVLFKKGAY
jgi:CheY-like chemotaxis protein